MKKKLYQWQEECLREWFANNGRGIVQAVTGSGKTFFALTAASRLKENLNQDLHLKIVVPTKALMLQWNKALKEFLSDSDKENGKTRNLREVIGLRGGGFKSSPDHPYMIYVINSARYELARQILAELKRGENVLLIADECHHYESGQNQLIFEFLPHIEQYQERFFSLGLSATLPVGQAQRYLATVLGPKIYHYGMTEAARHRTICPCDFYHISLTFQPSERTQYEDFSERMIFLYRRLLQAYPALGSAGQKERYELLRSLTGDKNRKIAETATQYMNLSYKRKSLVCLAASRISCVNNLVPRLNPEEKVLIFSERISQADELYGLLQKHYPERAGRYHSKMGDQANKNTLERFRAGSIRILIACKAIDEGIDVPDASIGIIMSGTSSQRQHIQRLGRMIRPDQAKKKASLYYLHMADTSEDSCFLPDIDERHLFELAYDLQTRTFIHPAYDEKAALLLEEMQNTGIGEEKLREAERCLRLGCVRSDWLLTQAEIEEQIGKCRYTSDRNYWVCMDRLAKLCIKTSQFDKYFS